MPTTSTLEWITPYQTWLSEEQSLNNAQLVVNHFIGSDWSRESLSAMLGNMRHESSVNPNMYEYGYEWEEDRGFGLVQWTPRSKYWDWAVSNGLDPYSGNSQLARINYEVDNNIQYIPNGHQRRYGNGDKYDFTFAEYRSNSVGESLHNLVEAFMWNYEGPSYSAGTDSLGDRKAFATRCYNELDWSGTGGGVTPTPVENGNEIITLLLCGALNGWYR